MRFLRKHEHDWNTYNWRRANESQFHDTRQCKICSRVERLIDGQWIKQSYLSFGEGGSKNCLLRPLLIIGGFIGIIIGAYLLMTSVTPREFLLCYLLLIFSPLMFFEGLIMEDY